MNEAALEEGGCIVLHDSIGIDEELNNSTKSWQHN